MLEDAVAARLLTREDYGGGEPGVAELTGHRATLSARRGTDPVVLTITSQAERPAALEEAATASPTILLTWSEAAKPPFNPDKIEVKPFSGIVDASPLAARLGEVWAVSGAIASGTRPPYAFIALERGWVQMPLPPRRSPMIHRRSSCSPQAQRSAASFGLRSMPAAPPHVPTIRRCRVWKSSARKASTPP
ncbi:hypothetical protein ACQ5SK_26675 [Bradyrhizobium japonicum]